VAGPLWLIIQAGSQGKAQGQDVRPPSFNYTVINMDIFKNDPETHAIDVVRRGIEPARGDMLRYGGLESIIGIQRGISIRNLP